MGSGGESMAEFPPFWHSGSALYNILLSLDVLIKRKQTAMKKKLDNLRIRLLRAVHKNPIEMLLAFLFCIVGCNYYESRGSGLENILHYAPFLFLTTYTLNRLTAGKRGRWVYYLSGLLFLPFSAMEWSGWTYTYLASLAVIHLLYLIGSWQRDNRLFVKYGLTYMGAVLSAGLLSLIAWLLSVSIYYSVTYIFEIGKEEGGRFISYALVFAFGGLMPLLFLVINEKKEGGEKNTKVFDILLNFVLSPALLVYAAILYLYFFKIAVLWSLPKGAVAYIVASFVGGGFLLKGCQSFLTHRWYDWFYNRFSLATLPALAMYWVGAGYRIRQYGYTEARVYLVAAGIILTLTTLLFFSRRAGRYLYVALAAVVVLSAVTYIPGITARDIERISQARRPALSDDERAALDMSTDYLHVQLKEPVDIRGYATFQPVWGYNAEEEIRTDFRADSFLVIQGKNHILLAEQADTLFRRQLQKAGVAEGDTLRASAYPAVLSIDMDSARFIIGEMSLTQTTRGGKVAYKVNYILGGYYLKR